jgi:hypothetical protein
VSVIVFNQPVGYDSSGKLDKVLPSYVVCRELGRITFVSGNYLFDEFADLKQLFDVEGSDDAGFYGVNYQSGLRLYNLNRGCWRTVKSRVVEPKEYGSTQDLLASTDAPTSWQDHGFRDYAFEMLSTRSGNYTAWQVGDAYGVEVSPVLNLPKTFYVDDLGWDGETTPGSSALTKIQHVTFGPDGRSLDENGNPKQQVFIFESVDKKIGGIKVTVLGDGKLRVD